MAMAAGELNLVPAEIYVDGSIKRPGQKEADGPPEWAGAAWVMPPSEWGADWTGQYYALGLRTNNENVELEAIFFALKHVTARQTGKERMSSEIVIYCDCNNALLRLRAVLDRGEDEDCALVGKVVSMMLTLDRDHGIPVRLVWVPAHRGIEGNERADTLAKKASALSEDGFGWQGWWASAGSPFESFEIVSPWAPDSLQNH
ncbi:hypothetical protein PRZ48_008973 [Zasmidium cellare]|uniref:RNase H type-1 domain-containing protein n=1 Tax=Zasmidium cellare TaxID=395010 RepID=A0ABR0EH05_ZASCE|nr:hypothetical protein PRZ48_008973 [Zasmidium cellare]